jgi:hypothetical protein
VPAPSGAHVKIGDYEFLLDVGPDKQPYLYEESTEFIPQGVLGSRGKVDVDQDERLLWRMSDWSGGEGARYWNPDDPTVYDYSEDSDTTDATLSGGAMNVRIPGQITGRPARRRSTITVTQNNSQPIGAIAQGRYWVACDREVGWTNDFSTWTMETSGVGMDITAAGGDHDRFYYAEGNGTDRVMRVVGESAGQDDLIATHANTNPWRNHMVVLDGRLYAWTGRKLHEIDIQDFSGTALVFGADPGYRTAYDIGTNNLTNGNYGGSTDDAWWADMVLGDNAIYFMISSRGMTSVYRFFKGEGAPFWNPDVGFTGKSLAYSNGKLYVFGHWGGHGSADGGYGTGYVIPVQTRNPLELGFFRKNQNANFQLQEACSSYGGQVMVAASNQGKVFIYDPRYDSISMLDDLPFTFSGSDKKIGALVTYGAYRGAIVYDARDGTPGTTIEAYVWDEDTPEFRETGNNTLDYTTPLFMPWYDFNLPYERKALIGFWVAYEVVGATTSGLANNSEIQIHYKLENDGDSWTSAGTILSTTTPSGGVKGHHFIAVSSASSTVKFQNMKYKVSVVGRGVGVADTAPPIVKDITVEARSLDHDRTWTLFLRTKDDVNRTRLRGNNREGEDARTYLRGLKSNQNIVTFLDYFRFSDHPQNRGAVSSHAVMVHSIEDVIEKPGEGVCRVVLKALKT